MTSMTGIEPQVLVLPAIADLTQAAGLKEALQAALARSEGLRIDAGGVARISSPCLQVLLTGVRAFAQSGGPGLMIAPRSEAFAETVRVLAIDAVLEQGETARG